MATPRKTRSQGPAENIDLDHPNGGARLGDDAGKSGGFNVEQELGFYSAYHSNPINRAIHFGCIPLLAWTALLMMAHVPLPGTEILVPIPGYPFAFQPNLALLVFSGYQLYYFLLEPIAAVTFLPIAVAMVTNATYLATFVPLWWPLRNTQHFHQPSSMPFTLALHVGSWIAQFIGHGVFEGRAPALLDNLGQALVAAPFFVWLEVLFGVFNYNPALNKKVQNAAGKRIVAMNRAAKLK